MPSLSAYAPLPACRPQTEAWKSAIGTFLLRLPGSAFAGESLLDAGRPFRVRQAQAVEQPIRADFQELGNPSKCCHGKRKITVFKRANGLHMHTRQLGQALLSPELLT